MRSAVVIGSDWSQESGPVKTLTEQVCTKLGISFKYNNVEMCSESIKFIHENNLKTLPVLISLNSDSDYVTRIKVGGFDYEGVVSFLSEENDDHIISMDECED